MASLPVGPRQILFLESGSWCKVFEKHCLKVLFSPYSIWGWEEEQLAWSSNMSILTGNGSDSARQKQRQFNKETSHLIVKLSITGGTLLSFFGGKNVQSTKDYIWETNSPSAKMSFFSELKFMFQDKNRGAMPLLLQIINLVMIVYVHRKHHSHQLCSHRCIIQRCHCFCVLKTFSTS